MADGVSCCEAAAIVADNGQPDSSLHTDTFSNIQMTCLLCRHSWGMLILLPSFCPSPGISTSETLSRLKDPADK